MPSTWNRNVDVDNAENYLVVTTTGSNPPPPAPAAPRSFTMPKVA